MEQSATSERLPLEDLRTVNSLHKDYPGVLTPSTLTWLLRTRDENGLSECLVPLGAKLLISKSRFEAWLAKRAGLSTSASGVTR